MEYLIQFQLNVFALIILAILFVTLIVKSSVNHIAKRLFKATIFFSAAAIIIEPMTWVFDGTHFLGSHFLEYFTNMLLIIIAPIICGFMLSYVDYFIFKDCKRLYKRYFYLIPTLFTVVMLIINIFFPIYFSVDKVTNIYQAESLLWVQYVMVGLYYLYMLAFTIIHRKKTQKSALVIFIIFFSLPILGMILQLSLENLFFSWTSITLSLLVVYIFLESVNSEKDYLTKLYNRQTYEKYISNLIDAQKQFSILFIDLDDFKGINDKFGHLKGDEVLIEFSRILEKTFKANIMISRLAGDEFIIVIENEIDVEASIKHTYTILENTDDAVLNSLKFSYGYQQHSEGMTVDQIYVNVDKKMYINKVKNKSK
ncbi:GGDEF domain-containing protein [Mycoplasmatota bacterium WC30]